MLLRSLVTSLLFALLLGACSCLFSVAPAPPVDNSEVLALQYLSQYQRQIDALSNQEVEAALASLGQTLTNPAQRMERVLLLGRRHSPDDLAQALMLLESLAQKNDADTRPWQDIAHLLERSYRAAYREQKRLREQIDKQAQQLRDSQRRVDQLSDKADQLTHKLDALKSIELNLPQPAGGNGPAAPAPSVPAVMPANPAAATPRSVAP